MTSSLHSTTLHHPGEAHGRAAGPSSAPLWAVQLELGEGWLSGERHAEPSLGPVPRCCALQLAQRQTVSPRLTTSAAETVPSARGLGGDHLSPLRPDAGPPDLDLSSCAEAENTAKTQSELLRAGTISLMHNCV